MIVVYKCFKFMFLLWINFDFFNLRKLFYYFMIFYIQVILCVSQLIFEILYYLFFVFIYCFYRDVKYLRQEFCIVGFRIFSFWKSVGIVVRFKICVELVNKD